MYNMIPHTHRPKTILAILEGARVIDPYSVVDQHVALPQGVHGFVFRGRQVELSTSDTPASRSSTVRNNADLERDAIILPSQLAQHNKHDGNHNHNPSASKVVVNAIFPKGTSRRRTAQKLAKAAINPDVLCGIGRSCEAVHNSSSRSSSSDSLMGYEQPDVDGGNDVALLETSNMHHELNNPSGSSYDESSNKFSQKDALSTRQSAPKPTLQIQVQSTSIQSREYLCAVSTAGEAESWVVALRWAAEHRRRGRTYRRSNSSDNDRVAVSSQIETKTSVILGRDVGKHDSNDARQGTINNEVKNDTDILSDDKLIVAGTIGEDSSGSQGYGADSKESLSSTESSWYKTDKDKTSGAEANTQAKEVANLSTSFESLVSVPSHTNETLPNQLFDSPELVEKKAVLLPQVETTIPPSERDAAVSSSPSSPKAKVSTGGTTIVITKVSTYQLPSLWCTDKSRTNCNNRQWWCTLPLPLPGDALDLTYEIQLLCLKHCHVDEVHSFRVDVTDKRGQVHPELMEERTICKSMNELIDLVDGLKKEFSNGDIDSIPNHVDDASDHSTPTRRGRPTSPRHDSVLDLLEEVQSELFACCRPSVHQTAKRVLPEIQASMDAAQTSIGIVDHAMRLLSNDKHVCSSHLFQRFLGLHHTQYSSKEIPQKRILKGESAGNIVRNWLSRVDSPSQMNKIVLGMAITIRHRQTGPMLSLVALWTALRCVGALWSLVSEKPLVVSIPVETYVFLIAVSFYYGHGIGMVTINDSDASVKYHERSSTVSTSLERNKSHKSMPEDDDHSTVADEDSVIDDEELYPEMESVVAEASVLSSPLPKFPDNKGISCWSNPDHTLFMVRGKTYLEDRVKVQTAPAVFQCRGVDVWITDNAERNISRHPDVLGGKLCYEDTFVVNFLLPFANFVAYFTVPPLEKMPRNAATVWEKFVKGDQQYRDAKLKLLPVVVEGPWIVKKAVGPGTSPAMLGKDLPLQYYFTEPSAARNGIYEVDVLVTASRIARGILNVVKGHTKSLSIAFAFIIEASEESELPETVLCAFQVHSLHLEDCPCLPQYYLGD